MDISKIKDTICNAVNMHPKNDDQDMLIIDNIDESKNALLISYISYAFFIKLEGKKISFYMIFKEESRSDIVRAYICNGYYCENIREIDNFCIGLSNSNLYIHSYAFLDDLIYHRINNIVKCSIKMYRAIQGMQNSSKT